MKNIRRSICLTVIAIAAQSVAADPSQERTMQEHEGIESTISNASEKHCVFAGVPYADGSVLEMAGQIRECVNINRSGLSERDKFAWRPIKNQVRTVAAEQ